MNANELADKRHECQFLSELIIWGIDAEEKLRQQQAEIEALKEALRMKVILNEHVQQAMKGYKELLK